MKSMQISIQLLIFCRVKDLRTSHNPYLKSKRYVFINQAIEKRDFSWSMIANITQYLFSLSSLTTWRAQNKKFRCKSSNLFIFSVFTKEIMYQNEFSATPVCSLHLCVCVCVCVCICTSPRTPSHTCTLILTFICLFSQPHRIRNDSKKKKMLLRTTFLLHPPITIDLLFLNSRDHLFMHSTSLIAASFST